VTAVNAQQIVVKNPDLLIAEVPTIAVS